MKTYFEFKEEYLSEGKVGLTKAKAGMKVEIQLRGPMARRIGAKKGDNPYGEGAKVQILGFGIVPYGKSPEKKHVITNSVDDFKKKYKQQIKDLKKQDDYGYDRELSFHNANGKIRKLANDLTQDGNVLKRWKPGFVGYIFQFLDGENKGKLGYLYIAEYYDDKWCIRIYGEDVEFDLIT